MSSSRHDMKLLIHAWWPVAVGICVIATESTDVFGADHTSGPLRWICEALFGKFSNPSWDEVHFFLRKSGHFIGYGLLGLAWLRAWWMTLPRSVFLVDTMLAIVGTAITASADEYHQSMLPNRTGTPWDVLLDCSGALAMQLLVYAFMRFFRPKRLERRARFSDL
jgi:VanZ family protein